MTLPPFVPAIAWLLPYLSLFRLGRRTPNLSDAPPATSRTVSVVIPARNEAATILTVVDSILQSRYPSLELIVVDDRSTDATAALVASRAAGDTRLRLVSGRELPEGWYGKPWACFQGAEVARGEVLVFTDADTRHGPALLEQAIGALDANGADLLTIAPHQRCLTFWERLIMPQVWLLLGLRYHPDAVNHARHARDVIANGQFIMVRRAAYESVGTHAVVRQEVAEDLALAQECWRRGQKLHFAFAEQLMDTRMYTGLRELVEGWSKNIYLGGRRSFPEEPLRRALVPAALGIAVGFWLLPPAVLLLDALGAGFPAWHGAAFVAMGLSVGFWGMISRGMAIPMWYALGYPLGALATLLIIARSTLRGRHRVEWKGRRYGVSVNRT